MSVNSEACILCHRPIGSDEPSRRADVHGAVALGHAVCLEQLGALLAGGSSGGSGIGATAPLVAFVERHGEQWLLTKHDFAPRSYALLARLDVEPGPLAVQELYAWVRANEIALANPPDAVAKLKGAGLLALSRDGKARFARITPAGRKALLEMDPARAGGPPAKPAARPMSRARPRADAGTTRGRSVMQQAKLEGAPGAAIDIEKLRAFVAEKQPDGGQQTVLVLGFFNERVAKRGGLDSGTLEELWMASGIRPIQRMWQAAIDAKNDHGWFKVDGGGSYVMAPLGAYFVEKDMPGPSPPRKRKPSERRPSSETV